MLFDIALWENLHASELFKWNIIGETRGGSGDYGIVTMSFVIHSDALMILNSDDQAVRSG